MKKKLIAEFLVAEPDLIVESGGEAGIEKGQDNAGPFLSGRRPTARSRSSAGTTACLRGSRVPHFHASPLRL